MGARPSSSAMEELHEVAIDIDEPLRDLDDETLQCGDAHLELIYERLQGVLPQLDTEALCDAFWMLMRSMSHTHALAYLEGENIAEARLSGRYARCFHVSLRGEVLARLHNTNTFLVDARADFTYAHVIDQLLLTQYEDQGLVAAAEERLQRRAHYFKPCPLGDAVHCDEPRVCALCWVVYTRVDSFFYKQCCARLNTSLTVNFDATLYEYMDLEHLPFQLVLFLCGQQLTGDEADAATTHYEATNQWVKVPVWWLAL